jgi:hypothetical protein
MATVEEQTDVTGLVQSGRRRDAFRLIVSRYDLIAHWLQRIGNLAKARTSRRKLHYGVEASRLLREPAKTARVAVCIVRNRIHKNLRRKDGAGAQCRIVGDHHPTLPANVGLPSEESRQS